MTPLVKPLTKKTKKEGMGDLYITPDGGLALNMKTFLQRPEAKERMELMAKIAEVEVAKYEAEQEAKKKVAEAAAAE